MKVRRLSQLLGGFLVAVAVFCSVLLVTAAPCYAVAHDIPGTPMGPGGASGVVDSDTNPRDVYAVYLVAGQEVVFTESSNKIAWIDMYLYAPGYLTISTSHRVADNNTGFSGSPLDYTPAVSGVYYLVTSADSHGVTYTIAVHGTETMPAFTKTRLSSASSVKNKKTLKLSGTVSPSTAPNGNVTITKTRLVGKKWKSAGSATAKLVGGRFTYSFKPGYRGKWRFVAKYSAHTVGTTTYVSSKSATKSVTVK